MNTITRYGRVLFFNNKAGWGLIESAGDLVYVHHTDIVSKKRFKSLAQHNYVKMIVVDNPLNKRFKRANNVEVMVKRLIRSG